MSIITLETPLSHLYKLSIPCIYAIRCDESMSVYVSHTTNLLVAVGRIFERIDTQEYRGLKHDLQHHTVHIDVLSTEYSVLEDSSIKKMHTSNYASQYKQRGYAFYKPTNLVQYKIDRGIKLWQLKSFFVVDLVNSRNDRILVGAFKSKREMDRFCNLYYPNDTVNGFYYANNELTNKLRQLYNNENIERNERSEYRRNVEVVE
jgi:hypothetical protein